MEGIFKGWIKDGAFGFIAVKDGNGDVFLHVTDVSNDPFPKKGDRIIFDVVDGKKGRAAKNAKVPHKGQDRSFADKNENELLMDDIEELDTSSVDRHVLNEIASWKREAKAEDNYRYFWHVTEVEKISRGEKYFVIGRKGSGKTAICEYFNNLNGHDVFSEKLSFKQFPFNELYSHNNQSFTSPNHYITIWKYLIYSTICRLMLKNEAIDGELREELAALFGENISLSRRVKKWVGKEFGVSLFGLSFKVSNSAAERQAPENWIEYVDYVEDLLSKYAGTATYYVLFDELDEDYRDVNVTQTSRISIQR